MDPHRLDPAGGCPHAENLRLRAHADAVPVELPGGVPGAVVLGHEALRELLGHPDVAKSPAHFAALQQGRIPDGWPLRTFATVPGMTTADGADHRRLRAPVARVFSPRRIAALRPRVEALTDQLLDDVAASVGPDGTVDLRRTFALPLPLGVVCELLGVDEAHRAQLHRLSGLLVDSGATPQEATDANREMLEVLGTVVQERAAAPGDDLTSALLALRAEDAEEAHLTDAELLGTLLLLIVAGHETTLNLLTNAVRALCAHRDQLRSLQRGERPWADAVEETLRWDSPVSYFPFRYPVREVTVGGATLPAGTPVLAGYSAAGRDPAAHGPDADRFDIARTQPSRHLSLGHGAHFCLGAPLARLEAGVALERLFTRFPALDVAVPESELPPLPGFVGNSVAQLPVRLA